MCFIFMYVQQTSTNIDSLYFCTFNCITFTFTFTVLFDFVRHLEAPWLASTNCTARIHDRAHSVNHQYNPLQTCDLLHDVNKNLPIIFMLFCECSPLNSHILHHYLSGSGPGLPALLSQAGQTTLKRAYFPL